MRSMLRKTIADGVSVQTDLKRVMAKMLGQRILSKQKTTHLMISLPMVLCSHVFARINFDNNQQLINMQNGTNVNSNVVAINTNRWNNASGNIKVGIIVLANNENCNVMDVNTTIGTIITGNNTPQNIAFSPAATDVTVTKKIIVEMCGLRMKKNH